MRLISLDTETTGSSPAQGDRCVSIGLAEIVDARPTGRTLHVFVNPGRPVHWAAFRVHGISDDFLAAMPEFGDVADELLEFIGDSPCLAHNARFDRDMLLHDFRASNLPIPRLAFHDTVPFARANLVLPSYRLDALAISLGIRKEKRGQHSALEDAEILARAVCEIDRLRPGAIATWFTPKNRLAPLPKGWNHTVPQEQGGQAGLVLTGSAPRRLERPPPAIRPDPERAPASRPKDVAPKPPCARELREASWICGAVHRAADASSTPEEFIARLTQAGLLLRPVFRKDGTLNGMRFSTPEASVVGGDLGLTGADLMERGLAIDRRRHGDLARSLIETHDGIMGPIQALKERFTAKPDRAAPVEDEVPSQESWPEPFGAP